MALRLNVVGGAIRQGKGLAPYVADRGDPGPSAYQLWLAAGHAGTKAQYMASLKSAVPGPKGWSPVFAGEPDGTRTLFKLVDWTGGEGEKPAIGLYVGSNGYVAAKAAAFNFNPAKRSMTLSAQTNAQGVATFDLTPYGFASPPSVTALPATPAVISGPTFSAVGTVTKTSAVVTVRQQALLTAIVSLLAGATANIFVVEV